MMCISKKYILAISHLVLIFCITTHSEVNAHKDKAPKSDMSWVNLRNQYPSNFYLNGSRDKHIVALTFDDAPDPRFTPAILDILSKYDIKATFFVVGSRASRHPGLVKRIHDEGHSIGNHSYDHAIFSSLSLEDYRKQIKRTENIIEEITGYPPKFIRPPYGELLTHQVKWSKAAGYIIVNWDVDSEDWRNAPSSQKVINNIKKTLRPGSIILQHAGGGIGQNLNGTVEALPLIIEMLQEQNYEMKTIPELLGKTNNKLE